MSNNWLENNPSGTFLTPPARRRHTLSYFQRGNNRSACFYADEDYQFYLYYLEKLSKKEAVAIHAYVLMTNHVHLLLTPETSDGVSKPPYSRVETPTPV